jgi:hypothetical protein
MEDLLILLEKFKYVSLAVFCHFEWQRTHVAEYWPFSDWTALVHGIDSFE